MSHFIVLVAFLSCIANAQDVPPPPKPQDDGPSLADTMKFIEERLGAIGRVSAIFHTHDNITGNDWSHKRTGELTNVRTSVASCRIDSHWRMTVDEEVKADDDEWFLLRDIEELAVRPVEQARKENNSKDGHPEWTVRVDPPVFMITANWKNGSSSFYLYDESLANRIAKALQHAVELCGGGSKDPF